MMGPGEAITLVALIGLVIALLIAGTSIVKRWLQFKERELALTADRTAEKAAQYASHVEQLEARVRVLERIATDKGADLAQQIEDLRGPPQAISQFRTEERG
jgi:hypothetical protein